MPIRTQCSLLLAFSGAALCAACDSHSSTPFDRALTEPLLLRGEVLNSSPVIGQPSEIRWTQRHLWIADIAHDPALHLLDATTGRLVVSIGRKGEGPGEFASTPRIQVAPGDTSGAIWAWDMGSGRLTRLELIDPAAHNPVTITVAPDPNSGAVAGVGVPWRAVWIEPERLVGVHPSELARFSIISRSGKRLRTVPGELLGPNTLPLNERMKATMTGFQVCAWPDRGFALLYHYAGRIEYYDQDARRVRLADVPFASDGFEKDAGGNLKPTFGRSYYRSCAVHDDRLYAGFSGRSDSDYESSDPESYAVEYVHVFDWGGALRRVYRLEPAIFAIEMPSQGSELYATSLSTSAIYRFPLPIAVETTTNRSNQ